jgi:hypothetical protein
MNVVANERFYRSTSRAMIALMRGSEQNAGTTCSDCGLGSAAGELDCANLRDLLLARDFEQPALYWRDHRLAIDAYCVQHAAYVESAKSLAAHLCGLCIALEHWYDDSAMRTLQRWLNPELQKPTLPRFRGDLTIKHVHGIDDAVEYGRAVHDWARSAWEAYRDLHPLAREWLARSAAPARRRK